MFGGILEAFGGHFEGKTNQKQSKTNRKRLQKFSTNFLIGVQKRVLPRDSHYFLLGPINPFKGGVWGVFWRCLGVILKVKLTQKQPKTTSKTFY